MVARDDRRARVGDLLIVYPQCRRNDVHPSRRECYVGVINRIRRDTDANDTDAHVVWQGTIPHHYNRRYGYAVMNIHNDRRMFRIFREGQEIK